ncbi:hypothetical protein L2E82_25236 [Cichorium intybus]|uniref:Uncharacterized protein n=1 Tax=Cichorium intybus TaxID=13427 RepID=A0ACB9E3D3_CICIN|nr:hypothetical protein L2E82_25236 [Cichorium intybus]
MEIQLMIPSPAVDFNVESTNTTPYVTAPSTPHRFPNFFYTAPTSPIHSLAIGFQADEHEHDDDKDFAFDFTGQLEPPSISAADELFHCGKIKPLKPVSGTPSKSPTSRFSQAFSPRRMKKDFDAFTEALKQTSSDQAQTSQNPSKRGRESTTNTKTRDKESPSSSPFRISDILLEENTNQRNPTNQSSSLTWYNKWNLKNLLLFRSASEGSSRRSKDPVNKYSRIRKSGDAGEDVKNSSFRSTESLGSSRRVMRKVSAHEIHYTANRAVAEEMRKKTYLPYKSGLLGCLGFHNNGRGSIHEISRGITSVMKQR